MGGIRKRTSKRGTTRQRAKIHKKATEQRKKNKKASKQDSTWKSKKKQDPGIPNSFPYKDQVLAEIAEQKRLAVEAREARKLKGKERATAPAEDSDSDDENPGITTFYDRQPVNPVKTGSKNDADSDAEEEEEPPALVDTLLPTPQAALDRADVIVEVLDARDPSAFRSKWLEHNIQEGREATPGGKFKEKLLIVLNKADLAPRESVQAWLQVLRKELDATVVAATKGETQPIKGILQQWAAEKKDTLVAVFMGCPNVGKSTLINTLLGQSSRAVGPSSEPQPTTLSCAEIEVPHLPLSVIDTPGWEFEEEEDEEIEDEEEADAAEERLIKDLLTRNLGRVDKIKEPMPLVAWLVSRASAQDLALFYNVPSFIPGDVEGFLTGLARAQGRINKHGEPNFDAAARMVLRDWAQSTFPFYTTPGKVDFVATADDTLLENIRPIREWRKGSGMIKMTPVGIDDRKLSLDEEYIDAEADPEDDEDAYEDGGSESGEEVLFSDDEEPEASDEEDSETAEEAETAPVPSKSSLKRKRLSVGTENGTKRSKKASVAFADSLVSFEPQQVTKSSKLKRKNDEDIEAEVAVERKRQVADVPKRARTVPEAKTATNPPSKKKANKVTVAPGSEEKPYDFGAHFF